MIFAHFQFEKLLWDTGLDYIAGLDEVGRGCFAGPVVAAAVIFPKDYSITHEITDSKLLSPQKRQELARIIKQQALAFAVATMDVIVINKLGIGKATELAFNSALKQLPIIPLHLLIDGREVNSLSIPQTAIIKGDKQSISIAAASIIAKVHRDHLMEKLQPQYPNYNFARNKGYGTLKHREAIRQFGLSNLHRTSFALGKYL